MWTTLPPFQTLVFVRGQHQQEAGVNLHGYIMKLASFLVVLLAIALVAADVSKRELARRAEYEAIAKEIGLDRYGRALPSFSQVLAYVKPRLKSTSKLACNAVCVAAVIHFTAGLSAPAAGAIATLCQPVCDAAVEWFANKGGKRELVKEISMVN